MHLEGHACVRNSHPFKQISSRFRVKTAQLDLTEVFPCFFLSCKANARVNLAKTGHGPALSQIVVLFYVLFVSCRSVYCFCVNVYCTTATG